MMINADDLKKGYALSCIENYLIYLLSQKKYTWEYIYYKSFIKLKEIIRGLNSGQGFSNYKGVERLQVIAEDLGLVSLKEFPCNTNLSSFTKKWYAIQVTNQFMLKKYNYRPWRDDHHILMHNIFRNNQVEYLNDVPLDTGIMDMTEAQKFWRNYCF